MRRQRIKMIERRRIHHAHADHIFASTTCAIQRDQGRALDAWIDDDTFVAIDKCFGYAFVEPSARGDEGVRLI
jgi:hypothetical protein